MTYKLETQDPKIYTERCLGGQVRVALTDGAERRFYNANEQVEELLDSIVTDAIADVFKR